MLKMTRLLLLGVAVGSFSLAGCGGSKAAADCMTAMSQVNCPPGTRPEALSEGEDHFSGSGDVRTYSVDVGGGSNAACQYVCIPYCDCGISSIGGDGSVQCVPCD